MRGCSARGLVVTSVARAKPGDGVVAPNSALRHCAAARGTRPHRQESCFSNRSLTLQGTIATSPLGKATSRRLPSIFKSTRTRSRAAIPAHKPRHPVNGPLRTRSRSPERRLKLGLGCFGRTTKPLRSRARRLAMSASGTLAGRSPSITSERMPGSSERGAIAAQWRQKRTPETAVEWPAPSGHELHGVRESAENRFQNRGA